MSSDEPQPAVREMTVAEKILDHLLTNGPASYEEIGVGRTRVPIPAKMVGVAPFRPTLVGPSGPSGTVNGAPNRTVLYLRDEHDPETVIQAWFDANPEQADSNPKTLVEGIRRYGGDFSNYAPRLVRQNVSDEAWRDAYGGEP